MNKIALFINILFYYQAVQTSKINANELAAERDAQKRLNTRKFVITRLSRTQQNNGLIQRQLLKSR